MFSDATSWLYSENYSVVKFKHLKFTQARTHTNTVDVCVCVCVRALYKSAQVTAEISFVP